MMMLLRCADVKIVEVGTDIPKYRIPGYEKVGITVFGIGSSDRYNR